MKLKNRNDSKLDIEISRTSRFSRLYIVALKVGFGCLSYLMAGLSLGLVYVLSEMDYFVLSGVFRGERFFSDDGYYFAKQVVLVYGVFGFGCVLLLGPIGRQCVILWSWLLTFGYICVCIFVYLGRMSEYGVLLMRFMSVISLISHMSLCNFMFFLFDPNVTDSNSVIYRVLGFILGYFVCCPIVSFVLLRINVCVGLGFCQSDPVDSAFEMCRIVLTIFSISLISSICLTFQFMYDYLTNTDTGFVWVPSLMISNKVVAKTLFNFIDFELLCVVWLVNPIIITLVPYTTASHSQFHTLTFTHKLTFSLTLFIILLILHRDFVQQCFRNLGKLNMAIFNIMYTDGYIQLVDRHLRETPISTTPFPNYINTCSTNSPTDKSGVIRKIENTVVVPGFVAYPYLDDPFDDIDNQDKYLLHHSSNELSISPDAVFSFIFNGVNNYYSQFCKHIPFVDGSTHMNSQLFNSYNQQLFISIFNMINKYKQFPSSISPVFNYSDFVYLTFKHHVELFHSVFKPIECEILAIISSFDHLLKCFRCYLPVLKSYISEIIKKLNCIKECMCKIEFCVESYLNQLNENIRCYIKRLEIRVKCTVEISRVDSGCVYGLMVSLEQCREDLISCIKSKICCLKNTELDKEELCKIMSLLHPLCCSISTDICELCGIRSRIKCSKSIKSEMDSFKCHVNKYIESLTKTTCQIDSILGSGLYNRLNFIYCGVSTIICFIQSKIMDFKLSVRVVIRSSGEIICSEIERVSATIQCEIPSLCTIEKESSDLICCLRNHICCVRNIMCSVQETKKIMESQLKLMCCIRREISEMESSINNHVINFFKCSNQSITQNTIYLTKRLSGIGKHISNDGLTKLGLHSQGLRNLEKEEFGGIWTVLSNTAIVESKFVLSKLYENAKSAMEIIKTHSWFIHCPCMNYFKKLDIEGLDARYKMTSISEFIKNYKEPKFKNNIVLENEGNHICLCMVIRHILYPNLVKCLGWLVDSDFDILSTMSRRFDKYTGSYTYYVDKSKAVVFAIVVAEKLVLWMEERYLKAGFEISESKVKWCFCTKPYDVYYKFLISSIIYISFVVENMFDHQNETPKDSIQALSALKAELEHVKYVKGVEEKLSCEIRSTSIVIYISCYQLKSIVYYTGGKCNFLTDQIKASSVFDKICCCNQGTDGTCSCPACQEGSNNVSCPCHSGTPTNGCTKCKCSEIHIYLEFTIKHIPNGGGDLIFQKIYTVPNLWCLYKMNQCLAKNTECQCRGDKIDCIQCIKCKVSQYYRMLARVCQKLVPYQIFDTAILSLMCESNVDSIRKFIKTVNKIYHENLVKTTRNIRLYEKLEIGSIEGNSVNGRETNSYTYNDAYRINTSRAHGSLKYIVIKIVLILIIVVMTIFIRVKIETDDDYKIDSLLSEENGMCECGVENNNNGGETNNGINMKYNGSKNNGTRKTSRTKGMKKKSLMIVMSIISGLYLNVVIRDLYVVLSLEYNVWSYFVSVVVCLGLTCSLLSRYCVHLYDFVYVLEQYGLKMSKVESLVDDKFGGESGTSMISSQFVMLYGLLKSVVGDLTSALSMSVSQSSYNEMKDELYPYKNMAGALHRMISGSDEYLSNLGKLRESVMESAIVGGCVDLYNVLDFLSYVLMSKTFFEFDEYQAYFHGNERYVAWRLGKSLNHNFFLVSYYRYSTIYSIDAQVQNLKLGDKHLAERNCMMLWQMFGEMEIELITLRSMCEESLDVPMTDIQKDLLKSRFVDEYLTEFQKFQLYVVSTLFNVREHTRVRTREIESSFPFADLFNEQMLDKGRLSKLSAKYFDTNYRRLLSSMSLPTRTCDVSGHVEEVQRRVSAFCSHWLDLRYEYCKSIRSLGCEKAVNFAHDLVMSTLKEPEQIDTKITQMLANINLENIDFIQQLLETDETLKEKYQLKEFHNTLDTLTHIHPISDNYETTVLHYLNQYVISSLLNKDKIMLPLGIYLSWYGAALTEQHISCIHKYQFFI